MKDTTASRPKGIPKLRFPEFQDAGEWEVRGIGLLCELYQSQTLSASDLNMSGDYLVYGANGIIGNHDQYNHESSELIVTCRGSTCGEVGETLPKSWITGNAMVVKPKNECLSKKFLLYYFKNDGLRSVISGSAQPQITRTGFAPFKLCYPKPPEQQRIASPTACHPWMNGLRRRRSGSAPSKTTRRA